MLDEQVILQHADLRHPTVVVGALAFADDHGALDGFAARQELGLGDDVALAGLLAAVGAAAARRLEPGGSADGHRLVDARHLRLVLVGVGLRAVGVAGIFAAGVTGLVALVARFVGALGVVTLRAASPASTTSAAAAPHAVIPLADVLAIVRIVIIVAVGGSVFHVLVG